MFPLQKGNFIPLLWALSLTQILKCVQSQVWSDFKAVNRCLTEAGEDPPPGAHSLGGGISKATVTLHPLHFF